MEHTESIDLVRAFLELGIIILGAHFVSLIVERFGVPGVVGQIAAGVIAGPTVIGILSPTEPTTASVIRLIGEIGALVLLFEVGLEIDLTELRKVGRAALQVASVGVALPMIGGWGVAMALGISNGAALLAGGALAATSVGITARVFGDMKMLGSAESRIVLGAAVTDDVLGLLVLSVAVPIAAGTALSGGGLATTIGGAVAFVIGGGWLLTVAIPGVVNRVQWRHLPPDMPLVAGLGTMLIVAACASLTGLAPIIGAVIAGAAFAKTRVAHRIAEGCRPIGAFTIPMFFVGIGIETNLRSMTSARALAIAAALTAVAFVGKVAAGAFAGSSGADRIAVGLGMVPRGEVGLIFAAVGRASGVLDDELYGAILVAVLATTLIAPSLLRLRMSALARRIEVSDGGGQAALAPATIIAAIDLAETVSTGAPINADELRAITITDSAPAEWPKHKTPVLMRFIVRGDQGALQTLRVSGVISRCLPELDEFFERRKTEIFELDPFAHMRLPLVESIGTSASLDTHEVTAKSLRAALAALVLDVFGTEAFDLTATDGARIDTFLGRLVDDAEVSPILQIALDAVHLQLAADDPIVHSVHAINRLAASIATIERLNAARPLAEELQGTHGWYSSNLDAVVDEVGERISSAAPFGSVVHVATESIKSVGALSPQALDRIDHMTADMLVRLDPTVLSEAVQRVDPLPGPGRARVFRIATRPDASGSTTASEADNPRRSDHVQLTIAVVARHRVGISARVCRAISDRGLEVASGTMCRWPDGAWFGLFEVITTGGNAPETLIATLQSDISTGLLRRYRPRAIAPGPESTALNVHATSVPATSILGTSVLGTSDSGAGLTRITVSGADRHGLLADIAQAIESTTVQLVSATVSTSVDDDERIVDRFEIAHRTQRPLTAAEVDAVIKRIGYQNAL